MELCLKESVSPPKKTRSNDGNLDLPCSLPVTTRMKIKIFRLGDPNLNLPLTIASRGFPVDPKMAADPPSNLPEKTTGHRETSRSCKNGEKLSVFFFQLSPTAEKPD